MVNIKLNQLLKKFRLTQGELAKDTGIRQATISSYVNNSCKHIVKEHIDILCAYFGCELSDLVEYEYTPIEISKRAYLFKD